MTRTVQLSEDAYAILAAMKEGAESFSDVVLRLVSDRKDLDALLELPPAVPGWDDDGFHALAARKDVERMRETMAPRAAKGKRKAVK